MLKTVVLHVDVISNCTRGIEVNRPGLKDEFLIDID